MEGSEPGAGARTGFSMVPEELPSASGKQIPKLSYWSQGNLVNWHEGPCHRQERQCQVERVTLHSPHRPSFSSSLSCHLWALRPSPLLPCATGVSHAERVATGKGRSSSESPSDVELQTPETQCLRWEGQRCSAAFEPETSAMMGPQLRGFPHSQHGTIPQS